MGAIGFEPLALTPQAQAKTRLASLPKIPLAHTLACESQDIIQNSAAERVNDPDLGRLIEAWPTLPAALKAGIVAMIEATRK